MLSGLRMNQIETETLQLIEDWLNRAEIRYTEALKHFGWLEFPESIKDPEYFLYAYYQTRFTRYLEIIQGNNDNAKFELFAEWSNRGPTTRIIPEATSDNREPWEDPPPGY